MYAKESSVMKNEWTNEYISLDVLLKFWTFCITDFLEALKAKFLVKIYKMEDTVQILHNSTTKEGGSQKSSHTKW